MMIDRPLDLLNKLKGHYVSITLKDNEQKVIGKLIAFDIHINIVIEVNGSHTFIRGDIIKSVDETNSDIKIVDKKGGNK